MKKVALIGVIAISFFLLLPLSWRIGDRFFTHPLSQMLYDPVLLVCSDHVEALRWHEVVKNGATEPVGEGCTFHVSTDRQEWVKQSVTQLKSHGDSSWTLRVEQLGSNRQRIDLELLGDGVAGMIYEVRENEVIPLNSRRTGPFGAIYPLVINLLFWCALWLTVWGIRMRFTRTANIAN
jgi:hypothetical protein